MAFFSPVGEFRLPRHVQTSDKLPPGFRCIVVVVVVIVFVDVSAVIVADVIVVVVVVVIVFCFVVAVAVMHAGSIGGEW